MFSYLRNFFSKAEICTPELFTRIATSTFVAHVIPLYKHATAYRLRCKSKDMLNMALYTTPMD